MWKSVAPSENTSDAGPTLPFRGFCSGLPYPGLNPRGGVTLSPIGIAAHKPALLSDAGVTLEWAEIRPEQIHDVLSTHRPVCWDCHVIATLYRTHRNLIVERPAGAPRKLLIH